MTQIESLKTEQKFKRTEAGEIPVEWEVVKIEDCCDILDSERIPLNDEERRDIKGEYPYYGANGVVDWINKHIFDEDLILMAEDGGYFDQYETRTIAYLVNGKCWVNNHAIADNTSYLGVKNARRDKMQPELAIRVDYSMASIISPGETSYYLRLLS